MIKTVHVRGTITPTTTIKDKVLSNLSKALEESELADFTGLREISGGGKITFDRTYSYNSMTPNFAELILRLQKLVRSKAVKSLNLYGTLMVIMETNDDFPKLYRITVEHGNVTYKEGSLAWKDAAA